MIGQEERNDLLREIVNIGVGRAAGILNEMIQKEIVLEVPEVFMLTIDEFKQRLLYMEDLFMSKVTLKFTLGLEGKSEFMLTYENAKKITSVLIGEDLDSSELEIAVEGTINELGNILLNGLMGSFSNILNVELEYEVPAYSVHKLHDFSELSENTSGLIVICNTSFWINDIDFEAKLIIMIKKESINTFTDRLLGV